MSISNRMKDITDRIVVQLKVIDGLDDYNFKVTEYNIEKGFRLYNEAKSYPFISVASVTMIDSLQTDQVTYDVPVEVELYCYVQKAKDPLSEIEKFLIDIEKAIYTDESLDGNVWGLSLGLQAGSLEDLGIGVVTIKATSNYVVT